MHHAMTSSTAIAAPSDVAHLVREGSELLPSPATNGFRLDGRAEVFLDSAAVTEAVLSEEPAGSSAESQ